MKTKIESQISPKSCILGTYSGECADANITNNNGLDITREVWDEVFKSEEYKEGIKNGWFIGYLGHPDTPDYMNFAESCIVMTEGHIDANNKIQGTFNLIDTPTGRIVKTLQDAGVTFGISVRGAGDVMNNSVTPGTFDFRGFDLVAFPAYPESIPTFTAISASTDKTKQKMYKRICASIQTNVPNIYSVAALDAIQSQITPNCPEYELIETRKQELQQDVDSLEEEKISALTKMFAKLNVDYQKLLEENQALRTQMQNQQVLASRRLKSVERIYASQIHTAKTTINSLESKNSILSNRVANTRKAYLQASKNLSRIEQSHKQLKRRSRLDIVASKQLESDYDNLKDSNLKYQKELKSKNKQIEQQDLKILELSNRLDETVKQSNIASKDVSNRDIEIKDLQRDLSSCRRQISEYQNAYAELYASAIGVDFNKLNITASTKIDDIKKQISDNSIIQQNVSYLSSEVDETALDVLDDDLVTL